MATRRLSKSWEDYAPPSKRAQEEAPVLRTTRGGAALRPGKGAAGRGAAARTCLRMWRAMEPEPLADVSGRVPRIFRPP